jgi:catechol 2,3-dioxygenase-like lactoylglutathione lyase family enzyme
MAFKVEQIDHVHVFVADQSEAARWYERVFGLTVHGDPPEPGEGGPLVVSSDGGSTGLALFRRPDDERPPSVATTVAFRVGGEGFLAFLKRQGGEEGDGQDGPRLTRGDVVDHDYCFSLYFSDPDGNPYELTTYDYEQVRARLGGGD